MNYLLSVVFYIIGPQTPSKQTLTAENSDIRCKYMSIYLKTLKLLRVSLHKSVNKLAQIV